MKHTMYFGAHTSREFGCVVTTLPAIPAAEARGEWESTPGVQGSQFFSDNALEAVDMPVALYVPPETNINALMAWLSGEGQLRFNSWPWFWKARRTSAFTLTPCPIDDGWNVTVPFRVQPHRYMYPEAEPITFTQTKIITNPCTAEAQPLIELTGSGDIGLMVGLNTLGIDDLDGTIAIDCEAKEAYLTASGESANAMVTVVGDWPVLDVGQTAVLGVGNVTQIRVTPRWRYL